MPYHDLNIPYSPTVAIHHLTQTLSFASELVYTTLAISLEITGKLPKELPTIPTHATHPELPSNLTLLTRLTLTISDPSQNHHLPPLQQTFDLVALKPTNEKSLSLCCHSLDCDVISLDFTTRLPFILHPTTLMSAVKRGIRFEINYSPGLVGSTDAKRNLISGTTSLIRATRGRGIIVSSGAKDALGLRGPHDVMNLLAVWGLPGERAKEALVEEAGKVVELAGLKRGTYRGVVGVIDQGITTVVESKREEEANAMDAKGMGKAKAKGEPGVNRNVVKRKASNPPLNNGTEILGTSESSTALPLSKRQKKKLAKQARSQGGATQPEHKTKNDFPIRHESLHNATKESK